MANNNNNSNWGNAATSAVSGSPNIRISNTPNQTGSIPSPPSFSTTVDGSVYDVSYRGPKATRTPFNLTTVAGNPNFNLWINPMECSWRIPLRTTIEQIQGGAVHHEWKATGIGGQNAQKLDQAIINFTFQSGNIAPYSWADVNDVGSQNISDGSYSGEPSIPAGLGNFYDFLALLNQPNITSNGQPNYVQISYYSLMMPSILLSGFFTQEGVQWTDNADNPNGISNWGASFVVFTSQPALFENGTLSTKYSSIFG